MIVFLGTIIYPTSNWNVCIVDFPLFYDDLILRWGEKLVLVLYALSKSYSGSRYFLFKIDIANFGSLQSLLGYKVYEWEIMSILLKINNFINMLEKL